MNIVRGILDMLASCSVITPKEKTPQQIQEIQQLQKDLQNEQEKVFSLQKEIAKYSNRNYLTMFLGEYTKEQLRLEFVEYLSKFMPKARDHFSNLIDNENNPDAQFYEILNKVLDQVVAPLLIAPLPVSIFAVTLAECFYRDTFGYEETPIKSLLIQSEKETLKNLLGLLSQHCSDPLTYLVEKGFAPAVKFWLETGLFFPVSQTFLQRVYLSEFKTIVLDMNNGVLVDLLKLRVLMQMTDPVAELFLPLVNEDFDFNIHEDPPTFCKEWNKINFCYWPGLYYNTPYGEKVISKAFVVTITSDTKWVTPPNSLPKSGSGSPISVSETLTPGGKSTTTSPRNSGLIPSSQITPGGENTDNGTNIISDTNNDNSNNTNTKEGEVVSDTKNSSSENDTATPNEESRKEDTKHDPTSTEHNVSEILNEQNDNSDSEIEHSHTNSQFEEVMI